MTRPEDILAYWFPFEPDDPDTMRLRMQWWFRGGPEVDREIRDRFGVTLGAASRGELDAWAATPRGRLALIVVLDQFPRAIHRGTQQAFAQDAKALALTTSGIDAALDRGLDFFQRVFFGLPMGHAEDRGVQDRAVAYVRRLIEAHTPPHLPQMAAMMLGQAEKHREVVNRFGRFPTRNQALGRESTEAEKAYLEELARSGNNL